MWKEYTLSFCESSNYPVEAIAELVKSITVIEDNKQYREFFEKVLNDYEKDHSRKNIELLWRAIRESEIDISISGETIEFLFFVLCTKRLNELYKDAGIPQKYFEGMKNDFKIKLLECHRIRNIWGCFSGAWHCNFLCMECFAIGRLQYNLIRMPGCISLDGEKCFLGELAINVHIPAGEPLNKALIRESMKEAARFFAHNFENKEVLFVCHSWLLFPGHYQMLRKTSGIRQFMDEFEIIHVDIDSSKRNLWRIFGIESIQEVGCLPCETSLQAGYKKWLEQGKPIGDGMGIKYMMLESEKSLSEEKVKNER